MRILLLSHYYWPEIGAPQRRWSTLVSHLIAQGHQIIVAAPHPHYPHACRDEFFQSSVGRHRRRVKARLGGTWEDGELGERIIRVPYLHSGSSMARQILDQSVSASAAAATVLGRLRGRNSPDVIISTTPALPFLLAGDSVSRALGVPHIAEVRDAWPDLITELSLVSNAGGRWLPERAAAFLEDRALPGLLTRAQRRAAAVVVTTDGFCTRLRQRGVNAEVVRSGVGPADLDAARHVVSDAPAQGPRLNLLYVGTVGRSQDLSSAIRASTEVPGVAIRIVGDGADKPALRRLAESMAAPVEFFDQTTGAALAAHWDWADAGLVSLGDVPAHSRTVPSKLYSLMVRRVPVLGIVAGETAEIITDTDAGIVARPGDVESIADAMLSMTEVVVQPGETARRWVVENACVGVMGEKYDEILRQVRS